MKAPKLLIFGIWDATFENQTWNDFDTLQASNKTTIMKKAPSPVSKSILAECRKIKKKVFCTRAFANALYDNKYKSFPKHSFKILAKNAASYSSDFICSIYYFSSYYC